MDIEEVTSTTYTLVADDIGKTIKVRVSFTDDGGNEETLTSAPTAEVEAKLNIPATGLPTISGKAQVGETLTAHTSGIADPNGLENANFGYQWLADRYGHRRGHGQGLHPGCRRQGQLRKGSE